MKMLINVALAAALGLPAAALADTQPGILLTQISGSVLVDRGEGFLPILDEALLKPGDRVMVAKGGSATLSYGDDCSLPLQAPSMTTVEPTACSTSTQGTSGGGLFFATGSSVLGPLGAVGVSALNTNEETSLSP